jgi:hypothetical protein
MAEDLRQRNAVSRLNHQHPTDEILSLRRDIDRELDVHPELALEETFHRLSSEGHRALKHHIKKDAK